MLSSVAHTLNDIASKYDIAVVAVNHVTTRMDSSTSTSKIVPALGEQWSHCITNRLMLSWESTQQDCDDDDKEEKLMRMATLVKSPAKPNKSCFFDITEEGIRVRPSHSSIVPITCTYIHRISQSHQNHQEMKARGRG